MNAKLLAFLIILSLLSGGCTAPGPDRPAAPAQTTGPSQAPVAENPQAAAVEPTATQTPVPSATPAPTSTATPEPTATETPLPPSPTDTPEAMVEFRFTGDVRQMPDANAAVIASFSQGIHLRALNQDPSGQWIYVQVAPFAYGWVQQSSVEGSGLAGLLEATPAVTATPEPAGAGGLKCFLTVTYTDTGKPKLFQIYVQGLTPVNPYTIKLFSPKSSLVFAWEFKPRANGTFYQERAADKAVLGTYSLEVNFAGQKITDCSATVVQK